MGVTSPPIAPTVDLPLAVAQLSTNGRETAASELRMSRDPPS